MTTPTAATPSIEERMANLESRMGTLEAVMTLFIEEQREHRREVNARFDKIEEDQREHRREVNARFDRMETRLDWLETRIDQVASSIPRMLYAVIGIFTAVTVALIVSNVVG
ncbi:MAG: hypothetical protein F4X64_17495 [Chloroflexi bacterium]|nr:hypothetical protein [Chloroflexota bacterium]